jgi:hypothetical protein
MCVLLWDVYLEIKRLKDSYTGKIVHYKSYMESLQILCRIPMQILYRKWESWN